MTPTRIVALLAAVALLGVSAPALAEQLTLSASLVGSDEVPPNDSTGTGMVDATYDTDTNTLTYSITYSGLTGDATAAHFHGPAAPGENAPPVVPIDPSALASPIAGSATLDDAQEADLLAGKWYFNVHTAQYPDGEIRGQVMQANMSTMESSMMDSSMSSEMSSAEPVSSELSSALSSASSDLSSTDISASVSVSVSASGEVSVSAP